MMSLKFSLEETGTDQTNATSSEASKKWFWRGHSTVRFPPQIPTIRFAPPICDFPISKGTHRAYKRQNPVKYPVVSVCLHLRPTLGSIEQGSPRSVPISLFYSDLFQKSKNSLLDLFITPVNVNDQIEVTPIQSRGLPGQCKVRVRFLNVGIVQRSRGGKQRK